ncbi:hypothetical protein [Clostridium perfringens]|uniref:hypothetical protein n=1 Tax=Clostridium perfringens TaxID=1502 RepID=UPI002443C0DD|nr:hypothetical protein [Clostridium perfringens]MDG6893044.1 hypothetical protein [Clostridium perfringens]
MMNKIDKLINLFIERISFNLYKPDKNKKSEKDDMDNEKEKIFDVIINLKELKEELCSKQISLV